MSSLERHLNSIPGLHPPSTLVAVEAYENIQEQLALAKSSAESVCNEAPSGATCLNALAQVRRLRTTVDTYKWAARRSSVRDVFVDSWSAYWKYAAPADELRPVAQTGYDWLGLSTSAASGISTAVLMGETLLAEQAEKWWTMGPGADVATRPVNTSSFEANIRVIGALASAADALDSPGLLGIAVELADVIWTAFDCDDSVWPAGEIDMADKTPKCTRSTTLAEAATMQLEGWALSHYTGHARWNRKAQKVITSLKEHSKASPLPGLFPQHLSGNGIQWGQGFGMGGGTDSAYEYLLKVWIAQGRIPQAYMRRAIEKRMWINAMEGMAEYLVGQATPDAPITLGTRGGDANIYDFRPVLHHLACFVPGMLATGAVNNAYDNAGDARAAMRLAERLAETCADVSKRMSTGVAPESMMWTAVGDLRVLHSVNYLRPEILESMWVLWQVTGNSKWRDLGWELWESLEAATRAGPDGAHAGLLNVSPNDPVNGLESDDLQQGFWFSETLKYAWLLASPRNVLPLKQWVLTTEAHPFKIPTFPAWVVSYFSQGLYN